MSEMLSDEFWAKVAPPNERGCRLFRPTDHYGYGRFYDKDTRKQLRAHRVAWELQHGPIPDGLVVRHGCAWRNCVEHIRLGTQADNVQDMMEDGTHVSLTTIPDKVVSEIRRLYAAGGYTQRRLGEMFGCHQATVSKIVLGHRRGRGL